MVTINQEAIDVRVLLAGIKQYAVQHHFGSKVASEASSRATNLLTNGDKGSPQHILASDLAELVECTDLRGFSPAAALLFNNYGQGVLDGLAADGVYDTDNHGRLH